MNIVKKENNYLGIVLDILSVVLIFYLYYKTLTPFRPTIIFNRFYFGIMTILIIIIELLKYKLNNNAKIFNQNSNNILNSLSENHSINFNEISIKINKHILLTSCLFIYFLINNILDSFKIYANLYNDFSKAFNHCIKLLPYIIVFSAIVPISIYRYFRSEYRYEKKKLEFIKNMENNLK